MFHVKQSDEFKKFENIVDVFFKEKKDKVFQYFDYLLEYGKTINLYSKKNSGIIIKHFLDVLTSLKKIDLKEEIVYDIGSGNGLPGMLLAIFYPNIKFILVERKERKSLFLKIMSKKLKLNNVSILNKSLQYSDILSNSAIIMKAIKPSDIQNEIKKLPFKIKIYYFTVKNSNTNNKKNYILPIYNEKHFIEEIYYN